MTLLESLVVVALTALLSALAFPALARSARLVSYQEALVRLAADVSAARARAITSGRPATLAVGGDGTAYGTVDGAGVALPRDLRLRAPNGAPLFQPDGGAVGGPLLLAAPGWQAAIAIDPATGLSGTTSP